MKETKPGWNEDDAMVVYVTIHACHELKAMKNFTGMSGPYVECSLSPADPVATAQKQRTSFIPNTSNPKWVLLTTKSGTHFIIVIQQTPPERLQFLITKSDDHMKIRLNW